VLLGLKLPVPPLQVPVSAEPPILPFRVTAGLLEQTVTSSPALAVAVPETVSVDESCAVVQDGPVTVKVAVTDPTPFKVIVGCAAEASLIVAAPAGLTVQVRVPPVGTVEEASDIVKANPSVWQCSYESLPASAAGG